MTDVFEILEGRILNQFSESTNLLALLEAIYTQLQDTQDMLEALRDDRYIDTAEGVWLDVLGDIVGLPRPYADEDPDYIFTAKLTGEPDDPNKGCYLAGPPATGGYIQTWAGINVVADPTTLVSDVEYRKQIKAKAVANHRDGIISDFFTFLKDGFDVDSTITEQIGLISVELEDYLSEKERRFAEEYGPRSAGVKVDFINWP